jgi:hypothetical protein
MSWAWLIGIPVLLLGFVGTVLGIPASLIAIAQFVSPLVRKHSRAGRLAVKPATALVALDTTSVNLADLNLYCREHRPSRAAYAAAYKRIVEERHRQRRAK